MRFDPFLFRRRLLIFPKFQLQLIIANLGIILSVTAITWFWVWKALTDLKLGHSQSDAETQFFNRYVDYLSGQIVSEIGTSLVVALVGSSILTLLISHRFSGPVYRLMNMFRSIQKGERPTPRLTLRQSDFLGELPAVINDALDVLEGKQESAAMAAKIIQLPARNGAKDEPGRKAG